jgi:hypothetical protein
MDALIGQLNQAIAARQEVTYCYREKTAAFSRIA